MSGVVSSCVCICYCDALYASRLASGSQNRPLVRERIEKYLPRRHVYVRVYVCVCVCVCIYIVQYGCGFMCFAADGGLHHRHFESSRTKGQSLFLVTLNIIPTHIHIFLTAFFIVFIF